MHRLKRRLVMITGLVLMVALGGWLLRGRLTEKIDSYAQCARQGYPVSETEPPTCRAGGHTFLGPRTSPSPSSEPGLAQEFDILVDGDSGGAHPQSTQVITTLASWQSYWREIHAALPSVPPILPVNFATHDVIALSEGRQMTGGYTFKVAGIITTSAGASIRVTESIPTITCRVTQAVSNRYYIVRTAKLVGPVSFRITTEHQRCD